MAFDDTTYSPQIAYELGDFYKTQCTDISNVDNPSQMFLAAKLCYTLPTIPDHPANDEFHSKHRRLDNHQQLIQYRLTQNKLMELQQFGITHKLKLTKDPKPIPRKALFLLKAFYDPWLKDIKPDLMARSTVHIKIRKTAFMEVFEEMKMMYNIKGTFDVENIQQNVLSKHHQFINDEWRGPDFKHLKAGTKKGKTVSNLTVIYDKKGYKKRCNNSQEDWFRKYDGEFLAICIQKVKQLLGPSSIAKIHFGFRLMQKEVKFEWSKATKLVPTSWIFGTSCDKLQMAFTDLVQKDLKEIKKECERTKIDKRTKLTNLFRHSLNTDDNNVNINSINSNYEEVEMRDVSASNLHQHSTHNLHHSLHNNPLPPPIANQIGHNNISSLSSSLSSLSAAKEEIKALKERNTYLDQQLRNALISSSTSPSTSSGNNPLQQQQQRQQQQQQQRQVPEPTVTIPISLLTDLCDKVKMYENIFQQLFAHSSSLSSYQNNENNMNQINNPMGYLNNTNSSYVFNPTQMTTQIEPNRALQPNFSNDLITDYVHHNINTQLLFGNNLQNNPRNNPQNLQNLQNPQYIHNRRNLRNAVNSVAPRSSNNNQNNYHQAASSYSARSGHMQQPQPPPPPQQRRQSPPQHHANVNTDYVMADNNNNNINNCNSNNNIKAEQIHQKY